MNTDNSKDRSGRPERLRPLRKHSVLINSTPAELEPVQEQ